jgi:hypothetical protein
LIRGVFRIALPDPDGAKKWLFANRQGSSKRFLRIARPFFTPSENPRPKAEIG